MLKNWFRIKSLPFLLGLLSFGIFLATLQMSWNRVEKPFPGFLTFKNQVVGPSFLPAWTGHSQGIRYPQFNPKKFSPAVFTQNDFSRISLFPSIAGLLIVLMGVGLFLYLFPRPGIVPLLFFHFLVGNSLILLSEAQLTYHLTYLALFFLAFIPATLLHFTFLLSEMLVQKPHRSLLSIAPYLLSLLVFLPYAYFFGKSPALWVLGNHLLCAYLLLAYLFWLSRLIWIYQKPNLEFDRVFAKYLLLGQAIGLILPLGFAAVAFRFWGIPFSLNLASYLALLFPISLFLGIIPGQRRQLQTYLVQSEKRVALGDLLAGLAHELNNPLTFVHSSLEPLKDSLQYLKGVVHQPDEKTVKVFQQLDKMVVNMQEGMTRAEGLIKKFRELPSKRQAPKEEIDINPLIDKTIELLSPKWQGRIQVEKNFEEIPKVLGLQGELEQAFTNLLSNSMDATPDGGTIQVSTHEAASGVKVLIRDTGKGIPKHVLGRIFDPFFTTKDQGEGMGLGLAITLQIIKSHRGSIEVKSEEGKGTTFMVFIPY